MFSLKPPAPDLKSSLHYFMKLNLRVIIFMADLLNFIRSINMIHKIMQIYVNNMSYELHDCKHLYWPYNVDPVGLSYCLPTNI